MTLRTTDRLVYQPLPERPRVTWPQGRTVAVWHAPNVELYDYLPPGGGAPQGRVGAPDAEHYFHRDYSHRVGFWRMLRATDRHQVPGTVSCSLSLLERAPEVRDAMLERGWEIMSHGISNLRPMYDLTEEQEEEFFATSQQLALRYTGRPLKGMLGPKISGTGRTCDLMAKHGLTYHADWIHDEQPRPLRVEGGGRLVSLPYSYMLNDVPLLYARNYTAREFVDLVKAQVGRLLRDAERDGQARVACLATHPYVVSTPFFHRYLEETFEYFRSDDRIWLTTAGEITDHYLEHHYDEQVASARAAGAAVEVTA